MQDCVRPAYWGASGIEVWGRRGTWSLACCGGLPPMLPSVALAQRQTEVVVRWMEQWSTSCTWTGVAGGLCTAWGGQSARPAYPAGACFSLMNKQTGAAAVGRMVGRAWRYAALLAFMSGEGGSGRQSGVWSGGVAACGVGCCVLFLDVGSPAFQLAERSRWSCAGWCFHPGLSL
ncbi:hypothetical protein CHARACLAT_006534 [Characodon lateralis]|uniref:Uncharacterized protein n=1 Tax=Characodon lateralis TaxID=208331 RepID=A0ABU7F1Q5_9TELE|nr:hypothetical protein [Characodon lateralis]